MLWTITVSKIVVCSSFRTNLATVASQEEPSADFDNEDDFDEDEDVPTLVAEESPEDEKPSKRQKRA